jgi:hypothetical protein
MSYQYPPQQQVIYQQVVRPPSNGMATTSLVLGIVAVVTGVWVLIPIIGMFFGFIAFLPAVLAAVFGHVGMSKATTVGGIGRGAALTGLVLGYVTVGLIVLTTIFWFIALGLSSAASSIST